MDIDLILERLAGAGPGVARYISPITDNDYGLVTSFLKRSINDINEQNQVKFEDSFEYIRLYFNSGGYQGYKYYDEVNDVLLLFAVGGKKRARVKMFKPLGTGGIDGLPVLMRLITNITSYPVQVVCVDKLMLKKLKKLAGVELKNIKEFSYYIYDLDMLNDLKGNRWKNVRQKVKNFHKNFPKLKVERLSPENYNKALHFIGQFRRDLLDNRGHSYADLEKNKFAVQYYASKNDFENIWGIVYMLRGRVVSVQLLYRLGKDSAAHAMGLADTEFNGLAEAAQVDVWGRVHGCGIRYINDGASWRPGLDRYKRKFNPIHYQRVFECKLKSV